MNQTQRDRLCLRIDTIFNNYMGITLKPTLTPKLEKIKEKALSVFKATKWRALKKQLEKEHFVTSKKYDDQIAALNKQIKKIRKEQERAVNRIQKKQMANDVRLAGIGDDGDIKIDIGKSNKYYNNGNHVHSFTLYSINPGYRMLDRKMGQWIWRRFKPVRELMLRKSEEMSKFIDEMILCESLEQARDIMKRVRKAFPYTKIHDADGKE